MEKKQEVISLFRKYGFEYRSNMSNSDFLAFTYKSGFFHNAELVSLSNQKTLEIEAKMKKASTQLEKLGFATKRTFYKTYEELENALFEGFFNTEDWKKKIKAEYKSHSKRVLSVLPQEADTYTYIEAPYLKNNKRIEDNIIDDIHKCLLVDGPLLSIIEAPAGFGKTCTSYEIINSLVNSDKDAPIPFFTEFSRDRQARVFSHIFVREVDRSFSSVNSEVVIEEVKEGRIVVVLDGFDELLHDSSSGEVTENSIENAEPMLETISELLIKNAKVILTSRRSAIFDGEMFHEWLKRYDDKFEINRYRIEKPEINHWITTERLEKLNNTNIDVTKLANPVLLSFIRFVSNEYFDELCKKPSIIVDKYFSSMLEREIDRQELRMNPDQQAELLRIVATDMCDNNYTSDSKEKIIGVIKEKAGVLLNEVRSRYSPIDKPTVDKLATTLSNHAFFDRSNQGDNNIEFVNEFVFGNYIADSAIHSSEEWIASDERFVEPAVLSYVPRTVNAKSLLWKKLTTMNEFLDISSRMKFEGYLTNSINDSVYNDADISSISIKSLTIFKSGVIENSIFNNCTFIETKFYFDNFKEITFYNCSFWDCEFVTESDSSPEINFLNCKDNNNFVNDAESEEINNENNDEQDIAIYILSKIWPIGHTSLKSLHYFTSNLFKTGEFPRKSIIKEIKSLKKKDILLDAHDSNFIALNKNKLTEIKTLLGRS